MGFWRGKQASAGAAPAGPTEEPEGDHQGTGSRQEQGINGEDQGDGEDGNVS